tara:strand:+ start:290 stop:952 length:663 start_codon:yes stop_codon:yes gene_type:complete
LSNKVEIYDDSEAVSVSDIAVYSLDINDILAGGTIAISSAVSIMEGGTITTTPTTETITPNADVNVKVSVTVDSPNTVDITIAGANEVSISEVASIGPTGATGATGPAGVGVFNEFIGNPFSVEPAQTGAIKHVGLNITDPQYELELSSTLFSPIVSSSAVAINGNGASDLFIVKLNNSAESKFVINLQGVTILGQFETTPTVVDGGMFYSASGDFYLGS